MVPVIDPVNPLITSVMVFLIGHMAIIFVYVVGGLYMSAVICAAVRATEYSLKSYIFPVKGIVHDVPML